MSQRILPIRSFHGISGTDSPRVKNAVIWPFSHSGIVGGRNRTDTNRPVTRQTKNSLGKIKPGCHSWISKMIYARHPLARGYNFCNCLCQIKRICRSANLVSNNRKRNIFLPETTLFSQNYVREANIAMQYAQLSIREQEQSRQSPPTVSKFHTAK